jgi:hypothetical protein
MVPPVIETLLEFCVASVPRPRLVRALDALEMLYVRVTAPVDALADRPNPFAEAATDVASDDTPAAAAADLVY